MAERVAFDLDLLIERHGYGYRARVLRSPVGDGQEVTFARPFSDLNRGILLEHMGLPQIRTRKVEPEAVTAAKRFGGQLFNAVFDGQVGLCLRRSEDRAREEDATLRIRLVLSDCPELADIPWEFLYDQENGSFVALSEATPVVRYLQLPKQPRPLRVALPLRVLAIRSEPADSQPLDLETEWSQVMASLRKFTDDGAIIVTDLVQPTVKDLLRVLRHEHFHVLHYMGHGKFTDQDGGVLLFADEAGRGTPVSGEKLGVILGDHPSLRLAVLNACEAGRTDPVDPFGGIADTLVRRGIPAVIAMQFEISDAAAIEFAPALYGALAAGRPVDAAVAEARKAIYAAVSPLEWATPVLHLRADNAHLFDIDQAGPGFWGRARSFANRHALVTAVIALLVAALAVTFPVVLPLVLNPHRPVPTPSASRSTAEPYCPSGTLAPLTVFGSAAFGPIAQGAYSAYKKLCPRAEINFQYDQGQSSAFSVDTLNNDVKEHKQVGSMIAMYDGPTTDGSFLIRHPVGVVIYSVIAHTHLYPTSIISTNTLQSLFASTSSDVPDEVAVGLQAGSGTRQALLWLFHEAAHSVTVTKSGCPPRAGDWECTESSYVATFNFVRTTRDAIGYVAIYGKVNGQPASYPDNGGPPIGYPNLSVLSIDGFAPTPGNVQSGSYAFAAGENLYTSPHPSALASSFITFLQHYLPQHPPQDYLACSKAPQSLASQPNSLVSQCKPPPS